MYFPQELNIKILHQMYTQKYPEHPVPYEFNRNIFQTKFNIDFGYSRSSCKETMTVVCVCLMPSSTEEVDNGEICIDLMKNLPVPNMSTNDVYYKRQLSFYLFVVHVLASG